MVGQVDERMGGQASGGMELVPKARSGSLVSKNSMC